MFKETDVFEINDYTTASDLERFVSDFEDVLRQWKLTLKRNTTSEYAAAEREAGKSAVINFAKVSFNVTYYKSNKKSTEDCSEENAFKEMMDTENDYLCDGHSVSRYYGFQKFIVVSPVDSKDTIFTEDQTKLLLSAISIALNNSNCFVPVLAQLFPRPRKFFQGVLVTSSSRTILDMVHFTQRSSNFNYLPELVTLFKGKLASPTGSCPSVNVSARLTFAVRSWPSEWLDLDDSLLHEDTDLTQFKTLRFHMRKEPIEEFLMHTTWPSISEELVSDSPYYTDLNPSQAPIWTCRAIFNDDIPLELSDSLLNFMSMKSAWSVKDIILGRVIETIDEKDTEIEVKQALDKLVTPIPSLSLPQFKTKLKLKSHSTIRQYINYLFSETNSTQENEEAFLEFRAYKSAPYNGFVWRLALLLCHIYHSYKDLSPIAYLWKDFINELRRYWESKEIIPGFESVSAPNLATCLFHQKLELLTCCISESKKHDERNKQVDFEMKDELLTDDEDEFYDCVEDTETIALEKHGRLARHENLRLLKTGEPLYVPITQDPPPMTEDMLQEQASILSQLGTSAEGSLLRAKMQCANLISDMEAFKAANPGAILEDFIRWHSPRDYIEDEDVPGAGTKGRLSARMQQTGNIWRELWDSSKPVIALRQKRLFDYTKEAEKILHYFSSFTLTDLVENLLPVLLHCAAAQLLSIRKSLAIEGDEISFDVANVSRSSFSGNFEYGVQIIRKVESAILKASSLKHKLELAHEAQFSEDSKLFEWEQVKPLVLDLIDNKEVKIATGDYLSLIIKRLIIEANLLVYKEKTTIGERDPQELLEKSENLPPPVAREFILRVHTSRPTVYSRSLPQRMYCLISPSEFRLASAVTEDAIYF